MASNGNDQDSKSTIPSDSPPVFALNERILSSMADKKDAAAHPWHDLEIGSSLLLFLFFFIYLQFYFNCIIFKKIYSAS